MTIGLQRTLVFVGRFSGDLVWPDRGDPRGLKRPIRSLLSLSPAEKYLIASSAASLWDNEPIFFSSSFSVRIEGSSVTALDAVCQKRVFQNHLFRIPLLLPR